MLNKIQTLPALIGHAESDEEPGHITQRYSKVEKRSERSPGQGHRIVRGNPGSPSVGDP